MALLKCKMCGGDLRIAQEDRIAVCEYCGSRQTLPRLESDRLVALFDRANQYRTDNEFDKASAIYESILMEVPEEAEAYWGICLCRYGIEYVKDPATQKRIPTCHRAQFKSILEDRDYLAALQYAEEPAGTLYEEEAVYIDTIQKGILETSAKEDPYDIFICYKESDETDNRTPDSLIAQEIYSELTAKGYRVFFSRITLEDKLGIEYEPYIFAALTSARIMLAVGTKPEHYEAAWVKNEWARYLSLIEAGHRKTMIACYRNMQPYEMPREFEILQALDVSRIGWKEDLVRGIAKILPAPKKEQAPRQAEAPAALKPSQDPASVERTLQSAVQMAHTIEQLKNQHPKVQDAQTKTTIGHYIGDLVAEMMGILDRCPANEWRVSWLRYCLYKQYGDYLSESYDSLKLDGYYNAALRAAPEGFKPLLQKERCYLVPKLEIWKEQPVRMSVAEPKAQCEETLDTLVSDETYSKAVALFGRSDLSSLERAARMFEELGNRRDAPAQREACLAKLARLQAQEQLERITSREAFLKSQLEVSKKVRNKKRYYRIMGLLILAAILLVVGCLTIDINAGVGTEKMSTLSPAAIIGIGAMIAVFVLLFVNLIVHMYLMGEKGKLLLFFVPMVNFYAMFIYGFPSIGALFRPLNNEEKDLLKGRAAFRQELSRLAKQREALKKDAAQKGI